MQDELIIFRKYIFEFNYISPIKIARQNVQELWEIISFSHRQTDSQLPFSPTFSIICLQLLTNLQQPHITDTPVTLWDAQGHKVLQVTVFFAFSIFFFSQLAWFNSSLFYWPDQRSAIGAILALSRDSSKEFYCTSPTQKCDSAIVFQIK